MNLLRFLSVASVTALGIFSPGYVANAAESDVATLVGFMTVDQRWSDSADPEAKYGFYQFESDGSSDFRAISPVGPENDWASSGGTYANGRYYCYSVWGNWMKYTLTYRVFDASTWKLVTSSSYTYQSSDKQSESSIKATWIPSAVMYDAISDRLFAFTHRYSNSDEGQLAEIDPATGVLAKIADTRYVAAAACDATGQIYAIDLSGTLSRVSVTDGRFTTVGFTGYYPTRDSEKNSGAAFDFRNGSLYYSLYGFATSSDRDYNINPVFGLMNIPTDDPSKSTISFSYPYDNQFGALVIRNSHPDSPDMIHDLKFAPDASDMTKAVITFTAPSTTYTSKPIDGTLTVRMSIDGVQQPEMTVSPGSQFTHTVEGMTPGNHSLSLKLEGNGHENNESYLTTFFGIDTPKAVTDLAVSYDESAKTATITWQLPAEGVNGGVVNTDDIRYRIVRYPDRKTVARSARTCSFTDDMSVSFNKYYYAVYPYYSSNPAIEGAGSRTPTTLMGTPLQLPYTQSFDTRASMSLFTLIDANGDANPDPTWDSPNWTYDEQYGCAFYYGKSGHPADDYLVSPALDLSPDKLYRLTYQYYAYYGYGSHLRVVAGKDATPEALSTVLLDREFVSLFSDMPGLTEEVYFCPRNGERYLAIHHLSTTMEHLSIDNIAIEEFSSIEVPAAPTDLIASGVSSSSVSLSFRLPTENAGGATLSGKLAAYIYRGSDTANPAATIEGLTPGQLATWIDPTASVGVNIYTVKIGNSAGTGLPATTRINLSTGIPVTLPSVKATALNSRQVLVEWDAAAAAVDADGNRLDPASLRFLVYKPEGEAIPMIGRDIDGSRFIDSNPFEGLEEGQQLTYYFVSAVNASGESVAQVSNPVFIGDAYTLPFAETWTNQNAVTNPWVRALGNDATWYIVARGYDPLCEGQDGYGLMSCELDGNAAGSTGSAGIASPRIDLSGVTSPKLTYWVYRSPSYDERVSLSVGVDLGDNRITSIPASSVSARDSKEGWAEFTIPLDAYAGNSNVSFVFLANVVEGQRLHLDNVKIEGSTTANEVQLVSLTTPASEGVEGEKAEFSAIVRNAGSTDASNIRVDLKANGSVVASETIESLQAGRSYIVDLIWTPDETAVKTNIMTCELTAAADGSTANNSLESWFVVKKANYPYVTELSGESTIDALRVSWELPSATEEVEVFVDDVEIYDPFTLDRAGSWTLADLDKATPFSFSNGHGGVLSWPNSTSPQSFMVFAPGEVAASALPFTPHSGKQSFVSWPVMNSANDDWLISPEISGNEQLISFVARAISRDENAGEPFMIYYSKGGTDPSDFINLSGDIPVKATTDWRLFHYLLPEGATRFAIRYVGEDGNGIVIDDILFEGYPVSRKPDGYNLYRNGVKINDTLLKNRFFDDTDTEIGSEYTYRVAAVYNSHEGALSAPFIFGRTGLGNVNGVVCNIRAAEGSIVVEGAAGATVGVFTPEGRCLYSATAHEITRISVAPGVYLVKAGSTVAKIMVK